MLIAEGAVLQLKIKPKRHTENNEFFIAIHQINADVWKALNKKGLLELLHTLTQCSLHKTPSFVPLLALFHQSLCAQRIEIMGTSQRT